jgi:transposase-like protein
MADEKTPMTDAAYAATGGNECPYCHSDEVEGGSFDSDEWGGTQEIGCNDCGRRWVDKLTRVGYLGL